MAEDINNNNNNENGAENNQQQENTPKTVGRGFEAFFPCQSAADMFCDVFDIWSRHQDSLRLCLHDLLLGWHAVLSITKFVDLTC